MGTYREGDHVTFWCDHCETEFEFEAARIEDAWAAAEQDGWLRFKNDINDDDWQHICPECVDANNAKL